MEVVFKARKMSSDGKIVVGKVPGISGPYVRLEHGECRTSVCITNEPPSEEGLKPWKFPMNVGVIQLSDIGWAEVQGVFEQTLDFSWCSTGKAITYE